MVLIGDSGIGSKTSLLNVVINDKFIENVSSTDGVFYSSKIITLNKGELTIGFFDTSGQEKYKSLIKLFIKNADSIVLGYDVTSKGSFDNMKTFWYDFVLDFSNAIYYIY